MGRDRRGPREPQGRDTDAFVAGKRRPPPEGTGAESEYFDDCVAAHRSLRLELRDGQVLVGRVGGHDRDLVHFQTASGPEVIVRKSEIRLLVESDSDS